MSSAVSHVTRQDSPPTAWWKRLRPYLSLVLVGLAAFGLRLAVMKWVREPCSAPGEASVTGACFEYGGDTRYVGTQARYLLEGHGFINAGKAMYGIGGLDEPGAAHPPLFTLLLALVQWLGFRAVESWRVCTSIIGSIGVVLAGIAGWRLSAAISVDRASTDEDVREHAATSVGSIRTGMSEPATSRSGTKRRTLTTGPRSRFVGLTAAALAALNPLL
ncbi:MAG: hypothetical protein N2037_14140, partial [Acidimicrobiales bacterium]|nr:hypothetical protein [Acidimicrobiales bacterium]